MEFPKNPNKSERRRQEQISTVIEGIKGMQDIFLEVTPERVEEIAEADLLGYEPGFNWRTFSEYTKDI